ncbi:MAG: hypothetical protein IPN95_26550 [Bacteroidetes bacterium]|nr:hypothetical protein [Bacteroidota bacterium]
MASSVENIAKIRTYRSIEELRALWNTLKEKEPNLNWEAGLAFEYLIVRAFEIEGARATYSYPVELLGKKNIEQIDGLVSIDSLNLHVLIESKEWDATVPFGPMAKMRSQLMRRPQT